MEFNRIFLWIGGLLQLMVLAYCQPAAQPTPDKSNVYKDLLLGKTEEDFASMISVEELGQPKLLFFRTPITSFADVSLSDGYDKRTVNMYKNMMLNKDAPETLIEDREQSKEAARFTFPRVAVKRSPGAILSWAIPAANRVRVINTNYRPPGMNRPAA
ncbi:uncharacterized protein LOC129717569 [Wyeomyia smithii]|uniref:uncharacterized protein LOC129717569 n=1 Tax=Wyeomyia smithii TaxID=174621 RepID=UPI00246821A2|nr:uncharacterized protein LOC129717569 [Wyeomyia smithii]